ncbi:SKI family transcriptional corepressor 2-like [Hetaerina americana]|uniref:SKI family transcriptional corepressor 2-like n=1 Tax=Hetaerina americana TaxID=62018 RepID=UPI003A7F2675
MRPSAQVADKAVSTEDLEAALASPPPTAAQFPPVVLPFPISAPPPGDPSGGDPADRRCSGTPTPVAAELLRLEAALTALVAFAAPPDSSPPPVAHRSGHLNDSRHHRRHSHQPRPLRHPRRQRSHSQHHHHLQPPPPTHHHHHHHPHNPHAHPHRKSISVSSPRPRSARSESVGAVPTAHLPPAPASTAVALGNALDGRPPGSTWSLTSVVVSSAAASSTSRRWRQESAEGEDLEDMLDMEEDTEVCRMAGDAGVDEEQAVLEAMEKGQGRKRKKPRVRKKPAGRKKGSSAAAAAAAAAAAVACAPSASADSSEGLPPKARWAIVATACLLLLMSVLLVGITLRMAPVIDEMVRKENEQMMNSLNREGNTVVTTEDNTIGGSTEVDVGTSDSGASAAVTVNASVMGTEERVSNSPSSSSSLKGTP